MLHLAYVNTPQTLDSTTHPKYLVREERAQAKRQRRASAQEKRQSRVSGLDFGGPLVSRFGSEMFLMKAKGILLADEEDLERQLQAEQVRQLERGQTADRHRLRDDIVAVVTWPGEMVSGIKTLLCGCWAGMDAALEDDGAADEDCEPLLDGRKKVRVMPRHAAASFLRTSTSRVIREANRIL